MIFREKGKEWKKFIWKNMKKDIGKKLEIIVGKPLL